jgi:hypothetical protein
MKKYLVIALLILAVATAWAAYSTWYHNNLMPDGTDTLKLGDAANRWLQVYAKFVCGDTARVHLLTLAKDTTAGVNLFNRTAVVDTLLTCIAFDTTTMCLVLTPFNSRSATQAVSPLSLYGLASGKPIVARSIADTAAGDRFQWAVIKANR